MKKLFITILFFLPITVSGALSDNLIACWDFDENANQDRDDYVSGGTTNTFLDNNNVGKVASAVVDAGASFVASGSDYFDITDAAQTNLELDATDFSISMWLWLDSQPSNDSYFAIGGKGDGTDKWEIWYHNPLDIRFLYYRNGTFYGDSTVAWSPSTDTWYHAVATYDNSSGDCDWIVNTSNTDGNCTASAVGGTNTGDVRWATKAESTPAQFWDGDMDVVAIWDKVLTADEISELYNSGSGIGCADIAAAAAVEPDPEPQEMIIFSWFKNIKEKVLNWFT